MSDLIMRARVKDALKQEYKQTLESRISRFIKIHPHEIIPNTHFAAPITECFSQFRDGYYCGCISLTQSIAESLAKFLCLKNSWKPEKDFEKNVKRLFDRNFINDKIKKSFDAIWENRHDYHHLSSNILKEHDKLEALARKKIQLLQKVLKDLFEYSIANGKLIPKNQKYWDIKDGKSDVFLNFL